MALVPKRGISALACAASEEADQIVSCVLFIAHSETSRQATIFLQFSAYIRGQDQKQPFELVYDADNLVPDKTRLRPETKVIPPTRLDEIARHGHCDLYSLCLTLRAPCRVKCPPHRGSIAPKHDADPCFRQLMTLAKETEVRVLFDYNWIHESSKARFRKFVSNVGHFTGFHRGKKDADRYPLDDWTVFAPFQESEAPPSYTEASKKRERSHETPSPPHKRVLLSPLLLSPTEVATPSPRPPSPHNASAPDFHQAVETAVKGVLPGLLEAAVADVVRSLLRSSPSLTSSSPPSPAPAALSAPSEQKPTLASAHRTSLAQAKRRVQSFVDKTVDDVTYARTIAVNELHEEVDDCTVEMAVAKQDYTVEVEALYNAKLEELKEAAADVISEVEEHVANVYLNFRDQVNRHLLHGESSVKEVNKDAEAVLHSRRRATSLPPYLRIE